MTWLSTRRFSRALSSPAFTLDLGSFVAVLEELYLFSENGGGAAATTWISIS